MQNADENEGGNEGGNAGGSVIPPVQQVVVAAPAQTMMTAQCSMKDVLKCNGENFTDYEHEFLGIMEQLGLKDMLVIQLEAVVADTPVDAAYPAANRFQTRGPLDWWADSAATRHMTYDRGSLHNYKPVNNPWTVTGIKNAVATVHGIGDVHLTTKVIYSMCSHKSDLILTYTYYFPDWANPNIARRNLRPRTGNKSIFNYRDHAR